MTRYRYCEGELAGDVHCWDFGQDQCPECEMAEWQQRQSVPKSSTSVTPSPLPVTDETPF